jgi:hypothetical protein
MTVTPALCALLVLPASGTQLPVTVSGGGDCPAPAEVEARLRELLRPRPGSRPPRLASVEREAEGVRVIVRESWGEVVAERLLTPSGGCAEAAAAAALAIAAWETEGQSDFGAAPAPVLVAPAAPAPGPVARDAYDIGAGLGASLAGSWRPGALVRAAWIPRGQGLGLGAFAGWEPQRSADLSSGQIHWSRTALGAGPSLRWRGERLALEGHVEAAVAFLSLRGEGFATDLTSLGVSPGACGGGRVLWPLGGSLAAWLDAGVVFWPRRQSGFAIPGGEERTLPRLTVLFSLGVSAGQFR